jgi:hypothetical protein
MKTLYFIGGIYPPTISFSELRDLLLFNCHNKLKRLGKPHAALMRSFSIPSLRVTCARQLFTLSAALSFIVVSGQTEAETLRDVTRSQEMRRVELATGTSKTRRNSRGGENMSWYNGMDPKSNFALLWGDKSGANLALSWIGANMVNYKLTNTMSRRGSEFVKIETAIVDRERVPIKMEIMIPHPTYRMMVQYNTLKDFNEIQPPRLKVVASEELEFNGVKGMYYRAEKGSCSVVIKLAQLSVLHLQTRRCEYSSKMMDIAKNLDFNRFNEKLNT